MTTLRPRHPLTYPYDLDREGIVVGHAFAGVATIITFLVLTGAQGSLYYDAGVHDVFWFAAAGAHILVLAVMLTTAMLYRRGHSLRIVAGTALAAALLGAAVAVLPSVAAGRGWVSSVAYVLFALAFYTMLGAWVTLIARYAPMEWAGWLAGSAENAR